MAVVNDLRLYTGSVALQKYPSANAIEFPRLIVPALCDFYAQPKQQFPMFSVFFSDDFTAEVIRETVPAGSLTFTVPEFFRIVDDNIDEDEQSFAIVAEIGDDVPDGISCFQLGVGLTECFGRRGATEIRITDNDRMFI